MPPKTKVILIDDCQSFCDALQFLFEMNQHIEFIIYSNALEFLNNFPSGSKGILLIDLLMPSMNGMVLLEELQKLDNQFYTIVISAHADRHTAQTAKEKGAHEFLSKPFNLDYLLDRIKKFC